MVHSYVALASMSCCFALRSGHISGNDSCIQHEDTCTLAQSCSACISIITTLFVMDKGKHTWMVAPFHTQTPAPFTACAPLSIDVSICVCLRGHALVLIPAPPKARLLRLTLWIAIQAVRRSLNPSIRPMVHRMGDEPSKLACIL